METKNERSGADINKQENRRGFLRKTTGATIGLATGLASTQSGTAHTTEATTDVVQQDTTEITDWVELDNIRNNLDGEYVLTTDITENTAGYDEIVANRTDDEFTDQRGGPLEVGETVTLAQTPLADVQATAAATDSPVSVEITDAEEGIVEIQEAVDNTRGAVFEYTTTEPVFTGFKPLPASKTRNFFTGVFDGQGNEIQDLIIDTTGRVGLFSLVTGTVKNLGVTGYNVRNSGALRVGGVAGTLSDGGEITQCYATGNTVGEKGGAGGLVGVVFEATVTESYADADVAGVAAGGLVQVLFAGTVSNCYTRGFVAGERFAGGLVSRCAESEITDSYAVAGVGFAGPGANQEIGGVCATVRDSSVVTSYFSAEATRQDNGVGRQDSATIDITRLRDNAMRGASAQTEMADLDFDQTWDIVTDPADYPALQALAEESGPPAINGENPPQDLDNDGLYEDVNGDGELTLADVQLLFENRQSQPVEDNAEFFNFSRNDSTNPELPANGTITLADVQALYQRVIE